MSDFTKECERWMTAILEEDATFYKKSIGILWFKKYFVVKHQYGSRTKKVITKNEYYCSELEAKPLYKMYEEHGDVISKLNKMGL